MHEGDHARAFAGHCELHRRFANRVGLLDIGARRNVAGSALQVIGDRPVIFVFKAVFDELCDHGRHAAELRVTECIARSGVGDELPGRILDPFRDHYRAVPVSVDAGLHPR